jgi:hypothetical protein
MSYWSCFLCVGRGLFLVLLLLFSGRILICSLDWPRNPQSSCFSLSSAGITGMCHHSWLAFFVFDTEWEEGRTRVQEYVGKTLSPSGVFNNVSVETAWWLTVRKGSYCSGKLSRHLTHTHTHTHTHSQALVAHACNPSYSEQEDHDLKKAKASLGK